LEEVSRCKRKSVPAVWNLYPWSGDASRDGTVADNRKRTFSQGTIRKMRSICLRARESKEQISGSDFAAVISQSTHFALQQL
jgi:hypothetical protein